MARIERIQKRDDLAAEHRPVWDAIAESRGHIVGPFTVLLHSPELAKRAAHLGAFVRFESALPQDVRELVIISVARAMDCRFEWAAHSALAKKAGVREEAIAAIRNRRAPEGLTKDEAAIVTYVTTLLREHRSDEATFEAVRARFGVKGTVELTATASYYTMIACVLNGFDVQPDPGADVLPV